MATTKLTEREQSFVEWSQNEFNTYMKKWCESDRIIPFWTDFTECEVKHFSKIILDIDDLEDEEIEECESPKNVKKAITALTKIHKKIVEDNKTDMSKLIDLIVVYRRKQQQHDGLDNGISELYSFYGGLVEDLADFVADNIENYSDEEIDRFEGASCIGVR